jgi:acetate kinase
VRILVLNCGSSSLKFELIALDGRNEGVRLAAGNISGIGRNVTIRVRRGDKDEPTLSANLKDHGEATRWVFDWLQKPTDSHATAPDAIGHRIVHGGPRLSEPTAIDDDVIHEIAAVGELAPLHNGSALQAIKSARELIGITIPMVGVFDTAFHHDLPERASRYAIPREMADRGIRRYGFHGLAHRYMTERCAQLLGRRVQDLRLVTLQLGSGCSAAAIRGGTSVDTSMGFTPLEGLVMGTRCGDIDPAVMRYLCEHDRMTPSEVDEWLNHRCGLLGVSGTSADVRELLRLQALGDEGARLALELFCYRLRKYVGAYLAVLGGADAIVFGGGIGENSAEIRWQTCQGMEWLGLHMDERRNAGAVGIEREISGENSRIRAFVIPVDEEIIIARDTFECLRRG